MPRKKRLDRRKRALIAAATYAAYGGALSSRPRRKAAAFAGWSMKARLAYWGLVEESANK